MRQASVVIALACFAGTVVAQAATWAQCGGIGWSGATACVSGSVCTKQNDYYSQCVPGAAASSAAPPPPPPATTVAQPTGAPPTSTVSGPAPTGSQLRTVNDPVFHFYLQNHDGQPVLGPEASSGYFTIGTGTIELTGQPALFLNANMTASTSFKPLTLSGTATTTNWALEGDTIITTNPRELNFLACSTSDPNFYSLFLQTGNDQPAGASCSMQTLHLPCLC